jgi:hypothetical protein
MIGWFKKNSSEKLKSVTFYFAGGYRSFEVTDDIIDLLKQVAHGPNWKTTVTRLSNTEDGSERFINWDKVSYVEFK